MYIYIYIYVCWFRILIVDFDVANDLHIYYGCRYYHHDDYCYDYCRYEFSITYTQAPEVSKSPGPMEQLTIQSLGFPVAFKTISKSSSSSSPSSHHLLLLLIIIIITVIIVIVIAIVIVILACSDARCGFGQTSRSCCDLTVFELNDIVLSILTYPQNTFQFFLWHRLFLSTCWLHRQHFRTTRQALPLVAYPVGGSEQGRNPKFSSPPPPKKKWGTSILRKTPQFTVYKCLIAIHLLFCQRFHQFCGFEV